MRCVAMQCAALQCVALRPKQPPTPTFADLPTVAYSLLEASAVPTVAQSLAVVGGRHVPATEAVKADAITVVTAPEASAVNDCY